jgi:hypothetical protein
MSSKAAVQCKQIIANLCTVCGAAILADSQFCRQCGTAQVEGANTDGFSSQATVSLIRPNDLNDSLAYQTTVLEKEFYQEVSMPLIESATAELTSQKTEYFQRPLSKSLLLALLLVPI